MKFGVNKNVNAQPADSATADNKPAQPSVGKGFALKLPPKDSGAESGAGSASAGSGNDSNGGVKKSLFPGLGAARPVDGGAAESAPTKPAFQLGGASRGSSDGQRVETGAGVDESQASGNADGSNAGASTAAGFDLSGLASLDVSNIAESHDHATVGDERISQFMDEISAERPIRELPNDAEKELVGLLANLDSLYDMIHDPDMMGMALKSFMNELASYPQYREQIQPADVRLIIQASRRAGATARVKKAEKKSTRGTGTAKGKVKQNELAGLMSSLGIDMGSIGD